MRVSKCRKAEKAGTRQTLNREKLNQRQKFLAEYYRTKDKPRAVPQNGTNSTASSAADKRQTLTYSTEGATDVNFSDLHPDDSLKGTKTQKQEADYATIINLCTEKLLTNAMNDKALYMRATAYIRKKDYSAVRTHNIPRPCLMLSNFLISTPSQPIIIS